ncbi:hypothetical protein PUN28_012239 [Cardiocondyla obscurior]|uniref:Uncharacterized protein n=1 Tax=Cardiocondyla obscurior TaxID=286306 RepID=A0AAW2FBF3_9HYME
MVSNILIKLALTRTSYNGKKTNIKIKICYIYTKSRYKRETHVVTFAKLKKSTYKLFINNAQNTTFCNTDATYRAPFYVLSSSTPTYANAVRRARCEGPLTNNENKASGGQWRRERRTSGR